MNGASAMQKHRFLIVIAIQFKEVDGEKTTSPAGGSKKL